MTHQRIFITGGASGLGKAMALRFARAGWKVCIADLNDTRGGETLSALRGFGGDAHYLRCDVTREEDLRAAAEELNTRWGGVDVVVNNAGVAQAGAIEDVSIDDWRWIIDINLLGVVRGCKVFTPVFRRQGRGHFVNVASMAGLLDVPMMSSYNATKAAVVSLSETLHNELAEANIGVSVVCPSFFKTNLGDSLRTTDPRLGATMARLLERSAITADDIANDVFRAVEKREFYVLSHAEGRRAWLLKRFLPRDIYAKVMRKNTARMRSGPAPT
ncbi:SDR family oxidoreductase [Myxococcus sp. RHSTA-1-4]|uniref:SDR family oxidoreductase n=1 Tax=Myxococcus sp. RHSTA-1-4 TaxID=2874601 RepID=UPI001CBCBE22|nr:SDR family oxidoreductase [Myxococcus sp. RHSTA-1-4]MBZ4422154.1 SDR family oxidoreductase [Myxococcus sp. RHSTA-1-4]